MATSTLNNFDLRHFYHEAGHALMAYSLGYVVEYIDIKPTINRYCTGYNIENGLPGDDAIDCLVNRAKVLMAGGVAESIYVEKHAAINFDPMSTSDDKTSIVAINDLLNQMAVSNLQERGLTSSVYEYIYNNWMLIKNIVGELINNRGYISRDIITNTVAKTNAK